MAVSKPLLTEFGIYPRLASCASLLRWEILNHCILSLRFMLGESLTFEYFFAISAYVWDNWLSMRAGFGAFRYPLTRKLTFSLLHKLKYLYMHLVIPPLPHRLPTKSSAPFFYYAEPWSFDLSFDSRFFSDILKSRCFMPPPPIHIDEPDKSLKKSGLATAASAAADELRGNYHDWISECMQYFIRLQI